MLWMIRSLALVVTLLAAVPGAASAQTVEAPPADARSDAVQSLVEVLRDDDAREALIAHLLASAEAAGVAEAPDPDPEAPAQLVRELAEYTRELGEQASAFATTLTRSAGDVLGVMTGAQAVDWRELQEMLWAVLLVAAVTLGVFALLRIPSDRFFHYLSERGDSRSWTVAGTRLIAFAVTDALVILLAWAGGYAVALFTGVAGTMDIRQTLFLNAFLLIEMTKVALRVVFVPRHGRLRFAPMQDETAAYWYFWTSRLVSLLGYGILLVVPTVNVAVSPAVGHSVMLLIVVTALLTAILIVLQNRVPVRDALKARNRREPEDLLGRLLARVAVVWHLLAIVYLLALFVIWLARPADALHFMLVATGQSVLAILVGVVATVVIARTIAVGLRLPEDVRRTLPLLEQRLNAFVPGMLQIIRLIVAVLVVIAIAQAWQLVNFVGWLASEAGSDVISRLVSAALVVLVAMMLWLAVSSFIDYRLNPEGARVPTARERTLFSLFRNAFVVVLVVITTMLTLAQLGMNIAPLIAGAGVIGLAVAFGAQKLVADVINGAFIQIENAMNEGDVVTISGTTGVVEHLTIRSVGLRDLSGTYHVIPFGSVDQVSNFMRGFGYHVANIGVAYREDLDQVKTGMQEAFDRLLSTEHGAQIVGPFEMHGVVELADSAVVVRGRIKTLPGMQWAVGRAYTELVKRVFDEAGIEIPFPHLTLYMGAAEASPAPELPAPPTPERLEKRDQEGATGPDDPRPSGKTLPQSGDENTS